ncbi:hypothetical protein THRCLA_22354 [Thraustotheca clavata]|uniref:Crinkler effector protein N-terminal domain-containing protein n=1 Tax=Thraustotheca clavata TaxID=74557 RepID=A0A1V9Z4I2_9STRA|nr:hypothetical protein THRCLA_22354 [Thraustotheca clavata]
MVKIVLWCTEYGEGNLFSVEIERDAHVGELKQKIFEIQHYCDHFSFPPSALTLYMARNKSGVWLTSDLTTKEGLKQGRNYDDEYVEMISNWKIDKDYVGLEFQPEEHQIHILVDLPQNQVAKQLCEESNESGAWTPEDSCVEFLDAVALHLYNLYEFELFGSKPNFTDVMHALDNEKWSFRKRDFGYATCTTFPFYFTRDEWKTLLKISENATRQSVEREKSTTAEVQYIITLPGYIFCDDEVDSIKSIAKKAEVVKKRIDLIVKDLDGKVRNTTFGQPISFRQYLYPNKQDNERGFSFGLRQALVYMDIQNENMHKRSIPFRLPSSGFRFGEHETQQYATQLYQSEKNNCTLKPYPRPVMSFPISQYST